METVYHPWIYPRSCRWHGTHPGHFASWTQSLFTKTLVHPTIPSTCFDLQLVVSESELRKRFSNDINPIQKQWWEESQIYFAIHPVFLVSIFVVGKNSYFFMQFTNIEFLKIFYGCVGLVQRTIMIKGRCTPWLLESSIKLQLPCSNQACHRLQYHTNN